MKLLVVVFILCLLITSVSATTLIINCSNDTRLSNDPGSASVDWPTIRNNISATATVLNPLGATDYLSGGTIKTTTTSDGFDYNVRGALTFDTSSIPDNSVLYSAIVTLYVNSKGNTLGVMNASIIDGFPTNPVSFVKSDYSKTNFTRMATDIPYASIPSTNGTVNFTFITAGLNWINKTGYTSFMLTHSYDVDNTSITWSTNKQTYFQYRSNAYTAPYSPIQLTVTYLDTSPTANFTANITAGAQPLM